MNKLSRFYSWNAAKYCGIKIFKLRHDKNFKVLLAFIDPDYGEPFQLKFVHIRIIECRYNFLVMKYALCPKY